MRNLHSIIVTPSIWAWFSVIGGNGHILGGGVRHLYQSTREQPPPLGEASRSWWHAWEDPDDPLNPPCGPIQTRARNPYLSEWHSGQDCPNCEAWATEHHIRPQRLMDARAQDPWSMVGWNDRPVTPDPISGL